MFKNIFYGGKMKSLSILFFLVAIFLIMSLTEPLWATNQIVISLAKTGFGAVDTVWVDSSYEFQIAIENDALVGGIQLGLTITSPDGATWTWESQPNGYGPDGINTGGRYASVVAGSRMDPPADVWDLTDFIVTERDVDGISPDTLFPGGVAYMNGLSAGPLEHMFSLHFMPTDQGASGMGTICIDSAFIPPVGNLIFADAASGQAIVPDINTPLCFPVKSTCPFDSDNDGFGDPGHPENLCADDNCPNVANSDQTDDDGDGVGNACDICPGFDDNADADADGVPDGCDICAGFDDYADADGDGVPDGCDVCAGFDDNADADADGVPDGCDICVGFDDHADVDGDTVPDGCDNCPETPNTDQTDSDGDGIGDVCDYTCGDANDDQDVNVGDAVYLINYVFKSGPAPNPIEAGDANCDQAVNVGDAVYIINYAFKSGPVPCADCQ